MNDFWIGAAAGLSGGLWALLLLRIVFVLKRWREEGK